MEKQSIQFRSSAEDQAVSYEVRVLPDGQLGIYDSEGDESIYEIRPYQSVFQTIFLLTLEKISTDSPIRIVYCGRVYQWNHVLAHYTYARGRMSEEEFANETLIHA